MYIQSGTFYFVGNNSAKFALAVITNDVKTITKASGVYPKMAQRVILELKDKMKTTSLKLILKMKVTILSDNRSEVQYERNWVTAQTMHKKPLRV